MQQQSSHPDYAAVRHVLTAPSIALRTGSYIGEDDIDFAGLERERATMSGGEALLVEIAYDLWTSDRKIGLRTLVQRLDPANFSRVIEALEIARGSLGNRDALAA
jgi:hypothetical protein